MTDDKLWRRIRERIAARDGTVPERKGTMTVDDAREHYYSHSGSASSAVRQLAFAGIAVAWLLADPESFVEVDRSQLFAPLFLFVTSLACDLVQYYWLASFWGIFARRKEKLKEEEFVAPPWSNWIGLAAWSLKGVVVIVGYLLLALILVPALLSLGANDRTLF